MSLEFDELGHYKKMFEAAASQNNQLRSDRRFTAACHAMEALMLHPEFRDKTNHWIADEAVGQADALLRALEDPS
jgi:hypothetical protein